MKLFLNMKKKFFCDKNVKQSRDICSKLHDSHVKYSSEKIDGTETIIGREGHLNIVEEVYFEYTVGVRSVFKFKIDEINIYEAAKKSMMLAIENCKCNIEHVLIDAMKLDLDIPITSIIKGDAKSITIAAASVIAKVTRDKMMYELDKKYPMYGYKSHKGYPTKKHIEAIYKYGLIDGYRKTYGPVRDYLSKCNVITSDSDSNSSSN